MKVAVAYPGDLGEIDRLFSRIGAHYRVSSSVRRYGDGLPYDPPDNAAFEVLTGGSTFYFDRDGLLVAQRVCTFIESTKVRLPKVRKSKTDGTSR